MKRIVFPVALSLLLSLPAQAAIRAAYNTSLYEKKLGNAYKIGTVSPYDDVQLLSAQIIKINSDDYYHVEVSGQEGYVRVDDLEYISDTIINSLKDTTERLDALEAALDKIEELEKRIAELETGQAATKAPTETEAKDIANEEPNSSEPFVLDTGTWVAGEDFPAGKYNIKCISGTGMVFFYEDLDSRKESEYSSFEEYLMWSADMREMYLSTVGDEGNAVADMYEEEANNVRLAAGNCVYIETSMSIEFTPVQ